VLGVHEHGHLRLAADFSNFVSAEFEEGDAFGLVVESEVVERAFDFPAVRAERLHIERPHTPEVDRPGV
jgi:hypothetical protein